MQKDASRRRFPLADRVIEVIDDTLTGEVLLDEALKMMKTSEKMSVSSWIDLMSGTYPLSSESYQRIDLEFRRNLEPDENRVSIETSTRTTGKRSGGQGYPSNRKAQLSSL